MLIRTNIIQVYVNFSLPERFENFLKSVRYKFSPILAYSLLTLLLRDCLPSKAIAFFDVD